MSDRYRDKHARARRAVGLDPKAESAAQPYPAGARIRGTVGLIANREGTVKRESWDILPTGQMIVRFDDPVVGRFQWIAVLPAEIRPA